MTPQEALERLRNVPASSDIEEWVVASEEHKDGSLHLHAFIKYGKKTEWAPHKWDLDQYHGNYQKARSWQDVKAYCTKGSNFIASFDPEAATKKKACGRDLNKRLLDEDLRDLLQQGDIRLIDYPRLKAAKEMFLKDLEESLPRCTDWIPNLLNLTLPILPVDSKQKHLWLWSSSPNKGKTTFLKSLAKIHPCYWYSYSEQFQTPPPTTQFVFLDEYSKPWFTAQQLNLMCDGTWAYPVKGCQKVVLKDPLLIVCSNKAPDEVYPNCFPLVLARFRVFEL